MLETLERKIRDRNRTIRNLRRIIKQQKRLLASKDRVIFAQKAFYEAMLDECHNQHAHR